ncbi:isoprenoid synthase domain-containing protein [Colletotrichum navitas]|uniref:Isoprenoid synthase domain-containing protein n=1 Tax=Colletotrichum navitas TaxID=681940 RepID=A0AAD8PKL7_9PEZI|nr:isoprenoid synthase domain-containing protein [Colletotrichum navitas]KAK1566051.1 isoprenoid synthase domain-containing protein [Colletotrichum navitas]
MSGLYLAMEANGRPEPGLADPPAKLVIPAGLRNALEDMAMQDPRRAQELTDTLSQWAEGCLNHDAVHIQSWTEFSQQRIIEPISRLLLDLTSCLLQINLSTEELRLCQKLCQGVSLCVGVHFSLHGICNGLGFAKQPMPLVQAVMSLFQVDEKRALAFCDAQILSGADEFFFAVGNMDKISEVSRKVRLCMAKLPEYLPAEPMLVRPNPPARLVQQTNTHRGVKRDRDDADVCNDTDKPKVNGDVETSTPSKPWSMEEESIQRIVSPLPIPPLEATLEPVTAPFDYICTLQSKGFRNNLIRALTSWIPVPPAELDLVLTIVSGVHNTSLMLDDVQDNSPLRRSCPATHTLFGTAQTINSAVYQTVDLVARACRAGNPMLAKELIAGMQSLLVGQGLDLRWTHEVAQPTVEEYLQMIDGKTGALFIMIYRLMVAVSPTRSPVPGVEEFMLLFGRLFQIRDDFSNLTSERYSKAKGFCEDLDEGKCSFIILHAMNHAKPQSRQLLRNIFLQRRNGSMSVSHKEMVLHIVEEANSLRFAKETMRQLESALFEKLESLEIATGLKNTALRALLDALRTT